MVSWASFKENDRTKKSVKGQKQKILENISIFDSKDVWQVAETVHI